MGNTLKVSVIYPISSVISGYRSYAEKLISGLEKAHGISLEKLPVKKKEITFMGRPILGTASQMLFSKMRVPHGVIVHSLAPTVINRKTNVVTLHDIVPLLMKSKFADTYYRRKGYESIFSAVKGIKDIIVFTEFGKKHLNEHLGIELDRIHVVNQAINHDIFYPDPDRKLNLGKKLIITVGDMNPRKRFDILFRALGGIKNYRVIHIGPVNAWSDREKELHNIAYTYNNIEFAGHVENDTLRKYMSSADLLVHLSDGEGFGYTTVEGMACGTNVLVNSLDVFKETLGNMAFFTNLNEDDVRGAVKYALDHPKPKEELIEFSKKYSVDNMVNRTTSVSRKIVESQGIRN